MSRPRVLLLDHPSPSLRSLAATLEHEGFEVAHTEQPAEAVSILTSGACEVVLGEISLSAEEVLAAARSADSPPVIVFDDFAGLEASLEALRQGAFEALARPISEAEVLRTVRRALESHTLRAENARLRDELGARRDFGQLSSSDPCMRRIFATLASVADSRATLLLQGESGTGKTQLARTVHERSARRAGPFVEVNCGALPSSLLESELFGHVRGAFTGAIRDRAGKFEQAQGGTILLDEIGTASSELQVKLLRVLEEGRYERVGDARTRTVDARVIAASNVDLEQEVAAGRFRADLYYRVHVVAIEVPPLRERVGDIPLLAERFRVSFARLHGRADVTGFAPAGLAALCAQRWPGNVRELENAIERAVLVAAGPLLEVQDLFPERPPAPSPTPSAPEHHGPPNADWPAAFGPPDGALRHVLQGPERWLILRALEAHDGNRSATAAALGINRTTLFNKMRKYHLLSYPVGRRQASPAPDEAGTKPR
jgi:DNA-binding NtrC family response regulator